MCNTAVAGYFGWLIGPFTWPCECYTPLPIEGKEPKQIDAPGGA